jgi:hypothetical protein
MGRCYFGDRRGSVTVGTVDCLPSPRIIGNEMIAAGPAFEENVGHLLTSASRVYDSMATKESRKSSFRRWDWNNGSPG